ncbi:MAG: hypothetical protein E7142_05800 [Rikenellaceae bacterium]|nr:hypothetical protein [Rikenellaceae bacterium]
MIINKVLNVNSINLEALPFDRELFMESFLIENKDLLKLEQISDDIEIIGYEIPIKGCKRSNTDNGRADIIARYPSSDGDTIAIIELKKGKLPNDVIKNQLSLYLEHRHSINISKYNEVLKNAKKWIGIIVGEDISIDLAKEIVDSSSNSDILYGALTLKRYRGNDGIYVICDSYFPESIKTRKLFEITYEDGTIEQGIPTEMYIKLIKYIGIEKIYNECNIYCNKKQGHKIISTEKYANTTGHRLIDNKWWIYTHGSNSDKILWSKKLIKHFPSCKIKDIKII